MYPVQTESFKYRINLHRVRSDKRSSSYHYLACSNESLNLYKVYKIFHVLCMLLSLLTVPILRSIWFQLNS